MLSHIIRFWPSGRCGRCLLCMRKGCVTLVSVVLSLAAACTSVSSVPLCLRWGHARNLVLRCGRGCGNGHAALDLTSRPV